MSTPTTLWQVEFPDFPVTDMPAIPATWEDVSWHNDACPSFLAPAPAGREIQVFINYADPAAREMPDGPRYFVLTGPAGDALDTAVATDDWTEVLDTVAALTSRTAARDVNAIRVAARAFDPADRAHRVISRRAAATIGLSADDATAIILSGLPNGPGEEPRP